MCVCLSVLYFVYGLFLFFCFVSNFLYLGIYIYFFLWCIYFFTRQGIYWIVRVFIFLFLLANAPASARKKKKQTWMSKVYFFNATFSLRETFNHPVVKMHCVQMWSHFGKWKLPFIFRPKLCTLAFYINRLGLVFHNNRLDLVFHISRLDLKVDIAK